MYKLKLYEINNYNEYLMEDDDDELNGKNKKVEIRSDDWDVIRGMFIHWFNNIFVFEYPDGQENFDLILKENGFENNKYSRKRIKVKYNNECEIDIYDKLTPIELAAIHKATCEIYHDKNWKYFLIIC